MQHHGIACHPFGITGYGDASKGVMFIGIAPGSEEMRLGQPFVGPSGRLLNAILDAVEWPRTDVFCTNLICWRNDSPSADEIRKCLPRLMQEIELYKPKLIVLFGNIVNAAITGRDKLSRGAVHWAPEYNAYVMSTFHPAAALRESSLFNDIVRDLAKIPLIMQWPQDDSFNKVTYEVITSKEQAQQVFDSLAGKEVSLDVETDSAKEEKLDVFADRIVCFAVCDGQNTWVFPDEFVANLRWPDAKWIFHNGIFDTQSIRQNYGIQLKIHEDTMFMSYSLDERGGYHGLKSLSMEYCAAEAYAEDVRAYHKSRQAPPAAMMYEYNAKDTAYTYRLAQLLRPMQYKEEVRGFYENLILPAANAFSEIQRRGVFIDQRKLRELALEWLPRRLEMEDELVDLAQQYGFVGQINLNSPKQLSKLLYDILRLPGGPSTAAKILEELDHPFVTRLLEFRRLDHMVGTYILGIKDDIKRDGRVHADVMLHATVTGRLAYHEPPLQTIPKPYTMGDDYGRLRSIFAASDDEHVIIEADYGRAEIWCAYFESGDQQLLEDLQSSDYHARSASVILNKPLSEITKADRFTSKFVTFGIMYGRGAASLAEGELQCSLREAETYLANWLKRYPVYAKWREETRKTAIRTGELVSKTGRRRRFGMISGSDAHKALNQALNFPLQSLASDITLSALTELHTVLKPYDTYVCFTVHDSIIFEASKKHLDTVLKIIRDTMTRPRFPGITGIDIDVAVGPNWGEVKEI